MCECLSCRTCRGMMPWHDVMTWMQKSAPGQVRIFALVAGLHRKHCILCTKYYTISICIYIYITLYKHIISHRMTSYLFDFSWTVLELCGAMPLENELLGYFSQCLGFVAKMLVFRWKNKEKAAQTLFSFLILSCFDKMLVSYGKASKNQKKAW